MRGRAAFAWLLVCVCGTALAHRAPNSFVRLEASSQRVRAQMLVPLSELAYAMPGARGREDFAGYLLRHVAVETSDGGPEHLVRAVRSGCISIMPI